MLLNCAYFQSLVFLATNNHKDNLFLCWIMCFIQIHVFIFSMLEVWGEAMKELYVCVYQQWMLCIADLCFIILKMSFI